MTLDRRMICDFETTGPDGSVFRLGSVPWSWPDWSQAHADGTFANRWDDPEGTYRALYATSTRFGGFLEILSRFRPDRAVVAELQAIGGGGDPVAAGTVPREWFPRRLIGIAELDGLYADIGAASSLALLRSRFAARAIHHGLPDVDAAALRIIGAACTVTRPGTDVGMAR